MSFGYNGVDRARLLRKVPTHLRLANLCVNVRVRAVLHRVSCSNKMVLNIPNHELGQMEWIGCARCEKFQRNFV
jgi:hypothetical protein